MPCLMLIEMSDEWKSIVEVQAGQMRKRQSYEKAFYLSHT